MLRLPRSATFSAGKIGYAAACLASAVVVVKDGYSAKRGGAQYLHLSAAQSLAYVRARDTLPGVDNR